MSEKRFIFLITILTAMLSTSLIGCKSDGPDGGADIRYLRTPDKEAEAKPVIEENIPLLFPTGPTRQWKLAVNAGGKQIIETVRVGSPQTVGKIVGATTLTMYTNGKPYRTEVFQVHPDSLALVTAGGADKMTMSPPMVLVRTESPEGQDYKWEGQIQFKGATAPAQAYSRVHAAQDIETPAGKFKAYRVDTSLTTIIAGRAVTFPASRWFVPGVGIVKQNFRIGSAFVEKELISYKGG